jgi:hypothetical protein
MNKLNILALLLGLFCVGSLNAQNGRYLEPVFNQVTVDNNQQYGVNATVLFFSVFNQAVPEQLRMDVYRPAGDTETERPVVLFLHTGNFLPFNNPANPAQLGFNGSCGGTRRDSVVVEICTNLAKMGYVAAAVSYRLGWNPLAGTDVERRFGIINAAYRGVQDARTAIRYFKKSVAEDNNPWGVDTTRMVVFGQGTGGYISLATATLDNYLKIPTASGGKFLYDPDGPGPTPIIPMVLESLNGNINATNFGIRTNTGLPNGTPIDTFCYPNYPTYSSEFQLAVNLGGALADSSWIDPGQPAQISFHVPTDNFAPYGQGIVNVPGTPLQVVEVQGSYLAQKLHQQFGNNASFVGQPILELAGNQASAVANSPTGFNQVFAGLYPFNMPPDPANPSVPTTVAPWEWTSYVPATGTCNNSGISARAYVDTIMRFYAPRACFALGLEDCVEQILSQREPIAKDIPVALAPNPASAEIRFSADEDKQILSIQIFDRSGRMVRDIQGVNNSFYALQRNNLTSGMYVAKISFKEGFVAKSFLFD